jgi:DNA mismatch repair protein MutS
MSELRTILRLCNEQSLILGDELCSGTESISAVSIFVAGIQMLSKKRSSFIFSTHLHEIIHFEEIKNAKTVKLMHLAITYDREKDLLIYDRKLREGAGDNMYGLLVCKALSLPEEFLEMANELRKKYHPENDSMLSLKVSHYNNKKIKSLCELCKINMSSEVHHLQHQEFANKDGIIEHGIDSDLPAFHKNKLANLLSVCEDCHHKFHHSDSMKDDINSANGANSANSADKSDKKRVKVIKKTKTSKGTILQGI